MKAESGATFVTIVVQASDLLDNDLNKEPASDSILLIVWNGNDFVGGKTFEVFTKLWYTAVASLIELRRFWPRVVILSCSDHKRWECSEKWGKCMRLCIAYLKGQNFLVLPMTQFVEDVRPVIYNDNACH